MPIISVEHLKKYYQVHHKEPGLSGSIKSLFNRQYEDVEAVNDISFAIEEGELVGFIGPNGAGKTTTLKVLSGLLYPTDGAVSVMGFTPWERKTEFQKQFSLVMGQKNQLWWDLPAIESFNLNKEIYEVPDEQYKETLDNLVDMLDMKELLDVQVRKLSLGQRMKAELIAALLHRPRVLFLDEPTIGLDVVMQQKMREFIKEYNKKYGATIILTSHYMGDIKELCERIIMIDHGKIGFDGSLEHIIDEYATHKHLKVVLNGDFDENRVSELDAIGKVVKVELPRVEIEVPRKETSERAAKLLTEYQVVDLTIEDTPIEEIVRRVFGSQEHHA